MWFQVFLAIICTVCFTAGEIKNVENCGVSRLSEERIIGGVPALPGQFPWMVIVTHYWSVLRHLCGGAILNRNWIVTAAHCLIHGTNASHYGIAVGIHNLTEVKEPLKVSKVIPHENFVNGSTYQNDIALIRLTKPIFFQKYNGYVNAVCLPDKDEEPTGSAIVTGWGHTVDGGNETSEIPNAVTVPIVPRAQCHPIKRVASQLQPSQICAGSRDKDACQSDSGGPLVQKNSKGVHTLIGVVSYGYGCGQHRYPGVYTKISAYLDWLEKNMD